MGSMLKLPVGIQNFESLRKDSYLYVDKTQIIYDLVTCGRYYFLSRPRRFGKSMLLSTLHAYFDGKKELFDGLAIARLEKDWVKYPVLHLDLNTENYLDPDALNNKLGQVLSDWEAIYGSNPAEKSFPLRFEGVIRRAAEQTGQRVAILVDEYDKPMLQAIGNEELQERYRNTLKGFYGALKSMDQYIKFALLTGVTKFSKVSVFSDLNNLKDISMDRRYETICGITDQDLDSVFAPYIQRMADTMGETTNEVREELRKRYDGYHFLENATAVYNPFSVLNAFDADRFDNYWFETGTPTYLVTLLKQKNYNLERLSGIEIGASGFNNIDPNFIDPIPVIYQSGYLTIKGYNPRFRLYKLGFPNAEVEEGFLNFLLPYYTPLSITDTDFNIAKFISEVESGRIEDFLKRLSSLFADTPYELVKDLENHYQNVLFIVCKLMGFYVNAEYHTSQGRIDMVLQTPDFVYVMEFKLDGTAEEALAQINSNNYALPVEAGSRKVIKVGVNFSAQTRNIDRWLVE